jgi:hypothetical protein
VIFITNAGDEHVSPEAAAILADTPPFLFVTAGRGGNLELLGRLINGQIRRRVKDAEVFAEDLFPCIAFQPFGSDIP